MLLITIYLESINGKDTGLLLQNWQLTLIEPELTFPNEMRWGSLSHMITMLSSWGTASEWISTVWELNMQTPSGCHRDSLLQASIPVPIGVLPTQEWSGQKFPKKEKGCCHWLDGICNSIVLFSLSTVERFYWANKAEGNEKHAKLKKKKEQEWGV